MTMIDWSDPFAFAAGAYATYRAIVWAKPWSRHQHVWEVVETRETPGIDIEAIKEIARASNYGVSFETMMEHVEPPGIYVTSRCMCGAGKVERK